MLEARLVQVSNSAFFSSESGACGMLHAIWWLMAFFKLFEFLRFGSRWGWYSERGWWYYGHLLLLGLCLTGELSYSCNSYRLRCWRRLWTRLRIWFPAYVKFGLFHTWKYLTFIQHRLRLNFLKKDFVCNHWIVATAVWYAWRFKATASTSIVATRIKVYRYHCLIWQRCCIVQTMRTHLLWRLRMTQIFFPYSLKTKRWTE